LRVDVASLDDTGKLRLKIEVQDTGIGIAPEEQANIFEPFVQVSRTNSRKGSGLGLAICSRFVQMMGGTIEVVSSPGVGSTFRVELPVQVAKESGADGAFTELESFIVAPDQPQFRILLIEDDEANRRLLARMLEDAGFQVRTAADGEKGIGVFSEWHPHFIWLDIRLPGMNGLEAVTRVRALPGGGDVKIAAFTASVFDEQRAAVLSSRIDDFVRKPAAPAAIFECMERLLGVRYSRSFPKTKPVEGSEPSDLSGVRQLPENLKSQLLKAVLLLDKERLMNVIRLISAINPVLGRSLSRHAENFEYTPLLHSLLSEDPR
jgi:CheY-like chemotaxis protein